MLTKPEAEAIVRDALEFAASECPWLVLPIREAGGIAAIMAALTAPPVLSEEEEAWCRTSPALKAQIVEKLRNYRETQTHASLRNGVAAAADVLERFTERVKPREVPGA